MLAVHFREFQQLFLVAPLRNGQCDAVERQFNVVCHNDFLRLAAQFLPYLHDGDRQDLVLVFMQFFLEFKGERLVYIAVGHMYIVHEGDILVVGHSKHVHIVDGMAHHLALGAEIIEQYILPLYLFRLFETQFFGKLLHLLKEHFLHLARVSFQYFACLLDVLHIFLV